MVTPSFSDVCNFFSLHALRSKSNLPPRDLENFSEACPPDLVHSFISTQPPSLLLRLFLLRLPRSRQRERESREKKKVYQIFLSSFTLNCLWVGFPASVGPLVIPHRTLGLSVMNPLCPTSCLPPLPLFFLTHSGGFSLSHFTFTK